MNDNEDGDDDYDAGNVDDDADPCVYEDSYKDRGGSRVRGYEVTASTRVVDSPRAMEGDFDIDGALTRREEATRATSGVGVALVSGSIGMLRSASLSDSGPGLSGPIHGSAPDIAGQNKANSLAIILSATMLLRYDLQESEAVERIENAVLNTLDRGCRMGDIFSAGHV